ncbi:hypothetical protein PNOK_0522400 [Pyrrhoderma noxium]|uniref:Uncharacterized protein n=1 Tax=Pyrrhoderma noxium TaxID=2282107 RepID=A0A286UFI1_9AGAM|nr:hypothetical protein PNOK_0522400 [Pyrrhoderma noxium]
MKSSPLSVQPLVRASRMALVCALHSLFYITDIRRRTGRFTRKKQFKDIKRYIESLSSKVKMSDTLTLELFL